MDMSKTDVLYRNIRKYHRANYFAALINHFHLKLGVEVGVRFANFSRDLLEHSSLDYLIGIDVEATKDAIQTMAKYSKYKFVIGTSPDCATSFSKNSLCFVYLDNDHSYHHVKAELPVWLNRVRQGGVLAGHDFMEYTDLTEGKFGVDDAVIEFCKVNGHTLYVSGCDSNNLDNLKEFSVVAGKKCTNRSKEEAPTFEDLMVPNWWIVKQ
jgi:hypothetical protein